MKKYGIVGYRGKLGRLLLERPNFVFLDCDITDIASIERQFPDGTTELDLIVNCAAISSIDECESDYKRAIKVNVHGLYNLHRVFGKRVLNISSDQVFSGNSWLLPSETTFRNPVNNYGFTKLGAEDISRMWGGKTLRLSRSVSMSDPDMASYEEYLSRGEQIEVPTFLKRNYLHRTQAVDGIEFFVNNYDNMPSVVNYGSLDNVSNFTLLKSYAAAKDQDGVLPRRFVMPGSPRPLKGGFRVSLAKKLGFPMYKLSDTVSRLVEEV